MGDVPASDKRWIALEGAVNVRDLGGLATVDGGRTRRRQLLRSDNLQGLTAGDVRYLVDEVGLRHVVDLRSDPEVTAEGPGPLTGEDAVTVHHLSLVPELGRRTDVALDADRVLPARRDGAIQAGAYLGYLRDRPESVLAVLRVLGRGDGACVFHCAAGKDRTGVVAALALAVAGATRQAIIADYVTSGERIGQILARLRASATYAPDLGDDDRVHMVHAAVMAEFLDVLDARYGGPLGWLTAHGWTGGDNAALRAVLR